MGRIFAAALLIVLAAPLCANAVEPVFGSLVVLQKAIRTSNAEPEARPRVAAAKSGTSVAVWHANDTANVNVADPDDDVFFSRSTNGGTSWSTPARLNSNGATDQGDDRFPSVATDDAGHWVAVWQSSDPLGGKLRSDFDILEAHSNDDGLTWSPPQMVNSGADGDWGADERPLVVFNRKDGWLVIWESTDSKKATIGGDRDILLSRSGDGGVTWSESVAVNGDAATDTGFDVAPYLAVGANGTLIAAWSSNEPFGSKLGEDSDILFARSLDGGLTWTSPEALNKSAPEDQGADSAPCLATDDSGNWVAVWSSWDTLGGTIGMDADVVAAHSSDDGESWSAPVPLNTTAATDSRGDEDPQVRSDGRGGWLAVWESWNSLSSGKLRPVEGLDFKTYQGEVGSDADILAAFSGDLGQSWTPPSPLDRSQKTDAGEDLRADLASDGSGNWIAVWQSINPTGRRVKVDWDIVATVGRLQTSAIGADHR